MLPFIQRINEIRHEHPALQQLTNVRFLDTENEALVAFTKRWGDDTVIAVVNIDPHHAQEGIGGRARTSSGSRRRSTSRTC